MNVFQTHSRIVSDYATYICSFLNIADPKIREVVEGELSQGKLWPEPLLQFNPSFEMVGSVDALCQEGTLHRDIADIFKGYSLYRHQVESHPLGDRGQGFRRHLWHRLGQIADLHRVDLPSFALQPAGAGRHGRRRLPDERPHQLAVR